MMVPWTSYSPEASHQVRAGPDNARPAGDVVEDLVNDGIGEDVEEMLAVDKIAQRASNQFEIGVGGRVGGVFRVRHLKPSTS
jgi:hypothetical protein